MEASASEKLKLYMYKEVYLMKKEGWKQPFFYGNEKNVRIYAVHLTIADQSEICRAYLVSVGYFL